MAVEALNFRKVSKVIGIKQSIKAVEKNTAATVYIAADADTRLTFPLEQVCRNQGVPVVGGHSMEELGGACGIDVGSASITILK